MIYVYEGIIFIQGCGWKNVSRRRISHGSEFSARFPLGLIVIDLYTQYTQLHPPPSTNLCTVSYTLPSSYIHFLSLSHIMYIISSNPQCPFSFYLIYNSVHYTHRLIKLTDRTQDVVFSMYVCFVHNNPEAVAQRSYAQSAQNKTYREPVIRRLRVTPLGFCLRVIMNETDINLDTPSFILLNDSYIACTYTYRISCEVYMCTHSLLYCTRTLFIHLI